MIRMLVSLVLLLLLGGCSTIGGMFGGEDNLEPPAPLVEFAPEMSVATRWSRAPVSGAGEEYVKLSPALAGNQLFVADGDGDVVALAVDSGGELWRRETGAVISGGVGFGSGLVLVGSSEAEVIALRADNGETVWQVDVSTEVLAPPRAASGVVLVRTIDGKLWALNASDGTRLWVHDRGVPVLSLRGTSAPAVAGDMVVAGFANGKLVALDLDRGTTRWERTVAVPRGRSELQRMVDIDSDPVIIGGLVFVATYHGRVAAVIQSDGRVLWDREMSSHAGLAVAGRTVYVVDEEDQVWALEAERGRALWKQDQLRARRLTRPVVVGDYLAVADLEGYVHWLSARDGHLVARTRVDDGAITATPAASLDTLYVLSDAGRVTALQPGR